MAIDITGIISESLSNHTEKILSNENSETLTYYIDPIEGERTVDRYYFSDLTWKIDKSYININSIKHSDKSIEFIRSIFTQLDEIIDLEFKQMNHNNGSHIDIYNFISSSSLDEKIVGLAAAQETNAGAWWDIFWKDSNSKINLTNYEKNTIVHEIGHSLGLSHPFNEPTNELWNSDDTIMSYNKGESGWNTWFSESDIDALIKIWGRENDGGFINFEKTSTNYQFIKRENDNYYVKSTVGLESISELDYVSFSDKDFRVKEDIIHVFDQVQDLNNISSKIYRLYKAAFNRFPDREGLNYWISKNRSGENSLKQTSKSFLNSIEFENLYGKDNKNEYYVKNLYNNVLDREPDHEGNIYWLGQLENRIEERFEVLLGFSESTENKLNFMDETGLTDIF